MLCYIFDRESMSRWISSKFYSLWEVYWTLHIHAYLCTIGCHPFDDLFVPTWLFFLLECNLLQILYFLIILRYLFFLLCSSLRSWSSMHYMSQKPLLCVLNNVKAILSKCILHEYDTSSVFLRLFIIGRLKDLRIVFMSIISNSSFLRTSCFCFVQF